MIILRDKMMKDKRMDLAGQWDFSISGTGKFDDTITLPSTTEVSKKGSFHVKEEETLYLSRKRSFTGVAGYRREVLIPEDWKGKNIFLYLERTKYTKVLVDGKMVSESHETVIPQRHNLTEWMTSGFHELIIEVDNDLEKYEDFSKTLYNGHQYTEHTQTNWNGIIGEIYLETAESIYITNVFIEKARQEQAFNLKIEIENGQEEEEILLIVNYGRENGQEKENSIEEQVDLKKGINEFQFKIREKNLALWDEFHRNLYHVQIMVKGRYKSITYSTTVGFRDILIKDKKILLNNHPISFRGNLDCCIYPLTGYAPMEADQWRKIYKQAKEYGINHYRFHSWCPPKAAFEAADMEGIYLQVELSCFANGFYNKNHPLYDRALNDYLYDQSMKIIKEYGNHPSFLIFAVGNEMIGDISEFEKLLKTLKGLRVDKLYTQGANNFLEDPVCSKEDDIWVTMRTTKRDNVRASFSHGDKPLGHIQQNHIYGTCHEYSKALSHSKIPVIAHEAGQYQSFPNFNEMEKYQGITEFTALKVFKKRLEEKGMGNMGEEFYYNSGSLLVQCYKEEIEALLRTRDLGGFQLLGLQDFPGQGTALIGIWDSLLDSKGFVSPAQWREFCNSQVILFKMNKGIYISGEAIEGEVWIYNFGEEDIICHELEIDIYEADNVITNAVLSAVRAPKGKLSYIDHVVLKTKKDEETTAAYIELRCNELRNHYPVWIYKEAEAESLKSPLIFNSYSPEAETALKQGKTVGIFSSRWKESIEGFFASDFWCYPMFKKTCEEKGMEVAPGTLGLVCKKKHPALKYFPTETFSSWQWKQIHCYSRPVILDDEETEIDIIVQVIDNFDRNHKLGFLFEKKLFQGKLLVCSMDILEHLDLPEVRQLYYSLAKYIQE